MITRRMTLTLALAAAAFAPLAVHAQADKATINALEGYFGSSMRTPARSCRNRSRPRTTGSSTCSDVRDAGQFAKDHIPGAVNIEWRQVFAQRAKLPKDKTILIYCNTSSFAAQVAMALRMDGFENVRLLYGGYNEWKARVGWKPTCGRGRRADGRCWL